MAGPGLVYLNPAQYQKEDELILKWQITGNKAASFLPLSSSAVYTTFDAIASQSTIDDFLGTTNEFLVAQFDSTSMGTDAFGVLINMSGQTGSSSGLNTTTNKAQAAQVLAMQLSLFSGSQGATVVQNGVVASTTLSSTSLTAGIACGSYGNIAFRGVLSGLDALSAGLIVAKIHWVSI